MHLTIRESVEGTVRELSNLMIRVAGGGALHRAARGAPTFDIRVPTRTLFELNKPFVESYAKRTPPFGYNGLGELVYKRTYSRPLPEGGNEQWYQTVERVVNGTYNMQFDWCKQSHLEWDVGRMSAEAMEMFDRMYHMKFLPPGRGLWAMGTALTTNRKLFAALNNCAFVSTEGLAADVTSPFCFLMDASMLGVGVGFDTKGAGSVYVNTSIKQSTNVVHVVEDSREGWVESLRVLLSAYVSADTSSTKPDSVLPVFDYSRLRPKGAPIRGFGGTSQGEEPLRQLHCDLVGVFSRNSTPDKGVHRPLTVTDIVDVMNLIGKCVVSGNVRRTAEIAFGDPDSDEYIALKDYKVNPSRSAFGWTSNNSVMAKVGMEYERLCEKVIQNGEPGFAWLSNMQKYGRMCDPVNHADYRAAGGNPCLEQTLESHEMCCLVETFPYRHESLSEFKRTLELAVIYAKTVTLGPTHWPKTNTIMLRNRRIGTSMSGIAQFVAKNGIETLREWCEEGYATVKKQDNYISERFAVPRSIKTTCIKPSGTVSLLAGATPGMHFPESRYYIRRVRLDASSPMVTALKNSGYSVVPSVSDPNNTVIVEFPIDSGEGVRTLHSVSMWEQLSLSAFLQRYWADNQVSCTVTFDPDTEGPQLHHALNYFQYQLKGISFLPRLEKGAYAQMPYEEISENLYIDMIKKVKPVQLDQKLSSSQEGSILPVPDRFCESDSCTVITIS